MGENVTSEMEKIDFKKIITKSELYEDVDFVKGTLEIITSTSLGREQKDLEREHWKLKRNEQREQLELERKAQREQWELEREHWKLIRKEQREQFELERKAQKEQWKLEREHWKFKRKEQWELQREH
ncbi:hypothetical protein CDAR_311951 [Caerostris darwini]|uniref:Uncharacterized protein n=1 Tax=Caerostris darwini TaxID=1538125 RepID=A0AAV4S6R8_9ARAC|nr:hypothetical protein CDAR_311951 [Caerostris darwini]